MWGGTDEAKSIRTIHTALDSGINLIDTAPAYGLGIAEEIVGKAIRHCRDKVVLATKCGLVWHTEQGTFHEVQYGKRVYCFLGSGSIRHELEASLERLQTDYIDLYQTHWQDETTPIEDTVDTMMRLKQEGKIRAVGVSNVSLAQLARYSARGSIDSMQEEYNMLNRDLEGRLLDYCRTNGIAILAYSPLAQGLLTGKISANQQFPESDFRRHHPRFSFGNRAKAVALLRSIQPLADRHQASIAQLAIAWAISRPGVTHALLGARGPEQVQESVLATELELDALEFSFINQQVERHATGMPHLL
jgi:aryl-alcohol dehydrogenase-like predicted oxidoreductase